MESNRTIEDGRRAAADTTRSFWLRFGRRAATAGLSFALVAAMGCDDETTESTKYDGPLWGVSSVFIAPEGRTSYITTARSLDVASVDPKAGIEIAGNAVVDFFGGRVYVGLEESPELVRYAPDDTGTLVEDGRISFQAKGFTRYPFGTAIADAHHAFAIDPDTLQIVAWDPTDLTIGKSVSISQFAKDGFTPEFWTVSVYEGKLYVPVRFANWTQGAIDQSVILAIYDVETLALLGTAEDDRCSSGGRPTFTANGDAYVVADGRSWSAQLFEHIAGTQISTNCVLRIKAGELDFDPDYLVETVDLIGGTPGEAGLLPDVASEPFPAPQGSGTAFLQVFDTRLLTPGTTIGFDFAFWSQPAFPYYRIEFGDTPTLAKVETLPATVIGWGSFESEEKIYTCLGSSDASCKLYEIDPTTNEARALFELAGTMNNIRRIR